MRAQTIFFHRNSSMLGHADNNLRRYSSKIDDDVVHAFQSFLHVLGYVKRWQSRIEITEGESHVQRESLDERTAHYDGQRLNDWLSHYRSSARVGRPAAPVDRARPPTALSWRRRPNPARASPSLSRIFPTNKVIGGTGYQWQLAHTPAGQSSVTSWMIHSPLILANTSHDRR